MILPYQDKQPKIHPSVLVAPGAHVVGDCVIGKNASIWFAAVVRADLAPIVIGDQTNIQDGAVVHVDWGRGCSIGKNVIVGHQATIHACTIEDRVLVGIGARVLSRAVVGAGSLIGAGALVLEDAVIPPGSLVLGVPGKVVRKLTAEEKSKRLPHAMRYVALAKEYKQYLG